MKHPAPEEWMPYLYQETSDISGLEAHLSECEACRQQLRQWQALKASLDSWRLPKRPNQSRSFWSARWRWAAAAILFLSMGFLANDLVKPGPRTDLQSLAAALEPIVHQSVQDSIGQQLREEWQSDLQFLQARLDLQQLEFQQLVLSAMGQSTAQTKRALGGVLAAYQEERQQWVQTLQALQLQRASDQQYFQNNLARLAVATGQEIQRANAGIRALAASVPFGSESDHLP